MQIFIYCKVTVHVSGVTAPIIRSTKNCNPSLQDNGGCGYDDAAFSCSMPRGVYVSCYVKYGFMVPQFRTGTIQECCELLLTLVIMQVSNTPNVERLSY